MPHPKLIAGLTLLLATVPTARGAEPGVAFFEAKIRPVLVEHCYRCHAEGKKIKGGLRLDTREGLRAGGDSGPAIRPGDPQASLLIQTLHHKNDIAMPPNGKLPDAVIADFERWVKQGAADPRTSQPTIVRSTIDIDQGKQFWSFRPLARGTLPTVRNGNWAADNIDRYVLARLEAKGLAPAGDADRRVLIRRVTFDLIGLPPSPAEVEAFVNDRADNALEKVVDRLLASPHFGETWGRHWLDLARYADSNGGDINATYHDAWRYRDYVISAVNADKPYDRFVQEQVAGDLLPFDNDRQRSEQLIATGFLVIGAKMLSERDKEKLRMDVVDEQIDTIGRAFLGLTLGCARCHDHKFDPIPTKDYYAIAGILRSTVTVEGIALGNGFISGWAKQKLPEPASLAAARQRVEADLKPLQDKLKQLQKLQADLKKKPAAKAELAKVEAELKSLGQQIKELQLLLPTLATAMAVHDAVKPADYRIALRGDPHRLGAPVERGFLSVLATDVPTSIGAQASGRLELARWLTHTQNPLLARVMVNRLWHHLFGQGLVRSVDNFGKQGDAPSHPELLDYLALEFKENGWSVKKLVRRLVLSRSYRMASTFNQRAAQVDPDNVLLWRMNRRRLNAEALRDAILATSGALDLSAGGTSVASLGESAVGIDTERFHRRAVYLPIIRADVAPFLEIFDGADPETVNGARATTTVPTQALFLMNSQFVREQALRVASGLKSSQPDEAARVDEVYRRLLGRPATAAERAKAQSFVQHNDLTALVQVLYASTMFRFLD